MATQTYEQLIAGANKIKENELPESNTHDIVGEQLLQMTNKMQEENSNNGKKFSELEKYESYNSAKLKLEGATTKSCEFVSSLMANHKYRIYFSGIGINEYLNNTIAGFNGSDGEVILQNYKPTESFIDFVSTKNYELCKISFNNVLEEFRNNNINLLIEDITDVSKLIDLSDSVDFLEKNSNLQVYTDSPILNSVIKELYINSNIDISNVTKATLYIANTYNENYVVGIVFKNSEGTSIVRMNKAYSSQSLANEELSNSDVRDYDDGYIIANYSNLEKGTFFDVGCKLYNICKSITYSPTIQHYIDNPINKFKGKKLSIIADSISSFWGYRPDDEYKNFYPNGDITSVDQTWWMQLVKDLGLILLQNASWSGSKVTGIANSDVTAAAGCSNKRINDLSKDGEVPDIVFTFIGINDFSDSNIIIGNWNKNMNLPDINTESTNEFSTAYALMLYKIQNKYPNARIFCFTLLNSGNSTPDTIDTGVYPTKRLKPGTEDEYETINDFNDTIRNIADGLGCDIIDTHNCGINFFNFDNTTMDKLHPSAHGAVLVKNKVRADLLSKY